jgi:hypothetical protein
MLAVPGGHTRQHKGDRHESHRRARTNGQCPAMNDEDQVWLTTNAWMLPEESW